MQVTILLLILIALLVTAIAGIIAAADLNDLEEDEVAVTVFYPCKLDYDDFEVGSPGPSFATREEAERYLALYPYFDEVHSTRVWTSVDEYDRWLNGEDA